jgi:hypothetical protein
MLFEDERCPGAAGARVPALLNGGLKAARASPDHRHRPGHDPLRRAARSFGAVTIVSRRHRLAHLGEPAFDATADLP